MTDVQYVGGGMLELIIKAVKTITKFSIVSLPVPQAKQVNVHEKDKNF